MHTNLPTLHKIARDRMEVLQHEAERRSLVREARVTRQNPKRRGILGRLGLLPRPNARRSEPCPTCT